MAFTGELLTGPDGNPYAYKVTGVSEGAGRATFTAADGNHQAILDVVASNGDTPPLPPGRYAGSLFGVGYNAQYELGLGNNAEQKEYVPIPAGRVIGMSRGPWVSLLQTETGEMYVCGTGVLGMGQPRQTVTTFTRLGIKHVETFAASNDQLAFIGTNGGLYTCGGNEYGGTGHGDNNPRWVPTRVGSRTDWVRVLLGDRSMYVVDRARKIWSCGMNFVGNLGLGDNVHRNVLTEIPDFICRDIEIKNSSHCIALNDEGKPFAWGKNDSLPGTSTGGLVTGIPASTDINTPTPMLLADPNATFYRCRSDVHTHYFLEEGTGALWGAGQGNRYQLGNGVAANLGEITFLSSDYEIEDLDCGSWNLTIVTKDNRIFTVGHPNRSGIDTDQPIQEFQEIIIPSKQTVRRIVKYADSGFVF